MGDVVHLRPNFRGTLDGAASSLEKAGLTPAQIESTLREVEPILEETLSKDIVFEPFPLPEGLTTEQAEQIAREDRDRLRRLSKIELERVARLVAVIVGLQGALKQ